MSREAINIIVVGAVIIIFNIIVGCVFTIFSGGGVRGDSIGLLQLGAAVGRGTMAVGVEYHGGFGGMGLGNPMVVVVVINLVGV